MNEFCRRYNRSHPDSSIEIETVLIPALSNGVMDPQKLMCGIAGGVPPDLIRQDRFTIGDWASRGTFTNLDEFIAEEKAKPDGLKEEDFYPACWKEALYNGSVYAIPNRTDCRALYYNKDLLIKAGYVDANGEAVPPKDWKELKEYALKLTEYDSKKQITRIGFSPNWGNCFLYMYGFLNGARFMTEDGRTCLLNAPEVVGALTFMVDIYDSLGGIEMVSRFESSNLAGAQDPFLINRLALKIDGDWFLENIARYRPDMNFGIAPPPHPIGKPSVSWSGGHSWAIPLGTKYTREAWEFVKWMVSYEAVDIETRVQIEYSKSRGKTYIPWMPARKSVSEKIFAKYSPHSQNLKNSLNVFLGLMNVTKFRPVTPVGQLLWDEHARSADIAIRHKMTVKQSLDAGTKVVQDALNELYQQNLYRTFNWNYPITIILLIALIFIAIRIFKDRKDIRINKELFAGYTFAAPWFIGFFLFIAGPIIVSIILSFCQYDVLHPAKYVGLKNYRVLFTEDRLFWKSLWNTVYMVLSVPLSMVIGLAIAMFLNSEIKGMAVYRTLFYLPAIVPSVASSVLWIWVLNPQNGLINANLGFIFKWLGVMPPSWLQSENWSKPALILMLLWGSGSTMIIWLAGLKGIPTSLYEAAEVDGAGSVSKFFNITLPMLSPYIFFNLVMGIIGTFQIFNQMYIMTGGGPADSTLSYVFHLFNNAFRYLKMGYASSMAWILFIIILILTLINFKIAPKWVHYETEN